jgi:uncharacterized protein (TIGR02588 family)
MAKRPDKKIPQKNRLEWAVFLLGLILTMSILVYLVYQSLNYTTGTPQLVLDYTREPGTYEANRYHVVLRNTGHETAEAIKVELALRRNGQVLERAELDIDFCPRQSQREGWMSFTSPPLITDTIQARIVSYEKP